MVEGHTTLNDLKAMNIKRHKIKTANNNLANSIEKRSKNKAETLKHPFKAK